ncbi:MAG: immune inhibitor A [Roseiflexus sp.]|nr:immune inhibitor A [Roseiflexus sp.]MCS7288064.1 immune inhibitor A [Roseiflexus sp.]MDW8148080.1 immune inhibitor A [Roseiflexaceae bacterium]MDW8233404.1 immune inhibitor A [Roseiflexaceae bacterium]
MTPFRIRPLPCLYSALVLLAVAFPSTCTTVAPLSTSSPTPLITLPTAAPSITPSPAPIAPVHPTAPAAAPADELATIAAAVPAPRDQRAISAAFSGGDIPDVARTTPLEVQPGEIETFWVADVSNHLNYTVTAHLRYAGPVALMYVDTSLDIPQPLIERSAKVFEERIYPRNRFLFGEERIPGVDGDVRLTILNTRIRGAGGYFSSADGVTRAVNRFSNEREMFVIDAVDFPPGSDAYNATLAHEFQHMIHWHRQPRSPTWFNEGLATLAEDLNGLGDNGAALAYLRNPDTQLTTWSPGNGVTRHYGAAQLFMRYLYEQYAGESRPADWIDADAGNNLQVLADLAARRRADVVRFEDLFADWAVANALNDPTIGDGRYAYRGLPARAATAQLDPGTTSGAVRQFGVDYLGPLEGPLTIDFDGADTVQLVGTLPIEGRFAWWSNRGDESVSTLTRRLDLRNVRRATLTFRLWHELERDYDYAFVTVSTDGGRSWRTLPGITTRTDDPQGHNLGHGLTGISGAPDAALGNARGRWVDERIDLTPFAGREVLLRFWVISDAAINGPGLLIDDIRIAEISVADGAETDTGEWEAAGFVRTSGILPQRWILRVLLFESNKTRIIAPEIDPQGRASMRLAAGQRAILLVSGATHFTTEPALYRIDLHQP